MEGLNAVFRKSIYLRARRFWPRYSLEGWLVAQIHRIYLDSYRLRYVVFFTQDCRGSSNIEAFEACMDEQREAFEAKTLDD